MAYVAQAAWILNETVRENVLMGTPLEESRCDPLPMILFNTVRFTV